MEGRKVMNMKRIIALIMAFVMVLLVSVPTFAAAPYTITITSAYTGHTYEAYQIFTGTLDSTETTLSDVEWGSNVDSSSLLAALKADGTYGSLFTNCTGAANVAKVLSDNNTNDALAEWFAQTASEYLTGTAYATSDETSTGNYEIEVSAAGYYLIKDRDNSVTAAGDAYTDIILWVSKSTTISSKTVYPTVTKTLSDDDYEAASIGDTVSYIITGTIPDTSAYTTYTYVFNDTLSKGLTYDSDSLSVVAYTAQAVPLSEFVGGTDYYTLDSGTFTKVDDTSDTPDSSTTYYVKSSLAGSGTDYTVETSGGSGSDTSITITMTNAKSLSKSYLIVTYEAELNSYAVIGGDGNTNTVTLTYSNNPNGSISTGTTPSSGSNTFTFELDVTKIDGSTESNPTPTTLENAEFVLYRYQSDGTTIEYVTVDSDNKVTGWTTTEPSTATFVTGTDGKISVIGLDEGTYYLKETKAPDGYNSITSPIKIEIVATLEDTDNDGLDEVKSLTVEVDDGGAVETTDTDKGSVSVTVKNNAGSVMPSTGGIGVTVYVVGGLVLIVAALGVMMAVKVKGKKNGN